MTDISEFRCLSQVISATSQLAMALKVAVFAKGEVDIICDAQGERKLIVELGIELSGSKKNPTNI